MCAQNNCCSGGPTLIFACSGAADVGEIADLGLEKGKSPATKENIAKVVQNAAEMLV